jgi:hypothetical protein
LRFSQTIDGRLYSNQHANPQYQTNLEIGQATINEQTFLISKGVQGTIMDACRSEYFTVQGI